MKPLPKDLVDVVSRVMQGAHPVVKESVAKDAAHMARLRTNAYIGDGSEATVNKAHQANIKKHGEKVAKAIHTNADHEAAHNATSVGSAGHKVHNDFVKNHLGGHGSAGHKDYHKHMEKKYMDSISEGYVLTEEEECVNKPEAEEPTANHGAAEAGNAGDKTPPTQGSSDTTKFYMAPNAQVMHAKEGKGNVLATMGEGVDEVAEVMFKESLKRIPVWELEPVEE